ncbi:DUF1592 domain-containing protein [Tuwongella immobilis]|nr:DUF1592 domain-containing protein [Tuwongella immobilis]
MLAILAVGWLTTTASAQPAANPTLSLSYARDIRPIVQRHCFACHKADKQRGGIDFEQFDTDAKANAAIQLWQSALERVAANEMPPEGNPPVSPADREKITQWLKSIEPKKPDCNQIATDDTRNFYRGFVMSRRLTKTEYRNTVRDLFGIDLKAGESIPADGAGGVGFDTNGSSLFTSTIQLEKYLESADQVLNVLLPTANGESPKLPQGTTPEHVTAARNRLLIATPTAGKPPREAAIAILRPFLRRAFRRAIEPSEIERHLQPFDRAIARGDSFEAALKLTLKGVLISPHFLFLAEPEPEKAGVYRLGGFPLASRMSYFLWASMPDDELLALAESGKLLDEGVLRQQIRRMRHHPNAIGFAESFAVQWLGLASLGGSVRPDAKLFPEFDAKLAESMRQETILFVDAIFREDRSLTDLIDGNFTFVNERLAKLYGIPNITGEAMQRVTLTDRRRGGVLGQASVLTVTSFPIRTSPVLRGRWVLEELLGSHVPPPPPNVPELKPNEGGMTAKSLRERLELHRKQADCASCHNRMDPIGFGFENFDPIGRWREQDANVAIDSSGKLPSGESFRGPAELKRILLERRRGEFTRNLVRKCYGYAMGRELDPFDDCVINACIEAMEKGQHKPSQLIEMIILSYPFQHRFSKR